MHACAKYAMFVVGIYKDCVYAMAFQCHLIYYMSCWVIENSMVTLLLTVGNNVTVACYNKALLLAKVTSTIY